MTKIDALLRVAPVLFVLLWSTGFVGAKLGLPYAEPLTFLLIRFAVVICILVVLAVVLRRPWPRHAGQYVHIGVAGALLHGGYLSGVFVAIAQGVSAGVVALIVGIQPLLTASLGAAFVQERLNRRQWLGFVLGFAGVALVVWDKLDWGGTRMIGFGFAAIALFSITLGTLYQKRFCSDLDLWTGSVVQFTAAAVVLLPFALVFENREVEYSGTFIFALGWLVLVLSLGAISLLHMLIRRGAATRVSALFYLTPPTTAAMAFAAFGETLSATAILGMGVAAAGVALALRTK